jgi:hypothetical protein
MIKTTELTRGVHFIEVQFGCTVNCIGWSLVGHMQGMDQISIASLQVPDLPPFELPSYIPNWDAQRILEAMTSQFETPDKMITMTLKPMKLPSNPLKTIRGIGTYTGWFTLVIIILAIPVAVYYRYRTGGALGTTQHEKTAVGNGCIQGYSALSTCWKDMDTQTEDAEDKHGRIPFPIREPLANEYKEENSKRQRETGSLSNNEGRGLTTRTSRRIRAEARDRKMDQAVETVMKRPTAPPAWEGHSTRK